MNEYIQKLNDEVVRKQRYMDAISRISQEFPDIKEIQTRWRRYLCSRSVGPIADQINFTHSCGCCSDSPLYAMPFIVRDGIAIYSDPPQIYIGQKNGYGYGEVPHEDWEEECQKYNINPDLYPAIQEYFDKYPPQDYDEDDICEF